MLQENLKKLRNEKGLSQEEMATQLHVVRQTVSKWEKGLSVPDATMLIKIANILGVKVSDLLHGVSLHEESVDEVAEQLAKINAQLAIKNCRTKRIIRVILIILFGCVLFQIFIMLIGMVSFNQYQDKNNITTTIEDVSKE